ncbi:LuxR C-terminal-related transcriptional regulator [Mycolicibacterium septicum]|uniref:LuxR C-terminal-related transcriptional regulator n=1 Tax=Mycolicibacterium septicum TaxID=98668 RepID=UPI0023606B90|nr:LuxR C-terminal-related transcriptional regulator [Mycolicibacterium septicum]
MGIDALVSPQMSDFADLADRLAAAADSRMGTTRALGQRISGDLTAMMDAVDRLRVHNPAPAQILEECGRALCAAAVFHRVMVSRVDGSTWSPQNCFAMTTDGRVVAEIGVGEDAGDRAITLASPLIEAEVVRRRLPALVNEADREPRAHPVLVQRLLSTEYVTAPIVVDDAVAALIHADNGRGGRVLTALDRDLLRMYADNVGVQWERGEIAERQVTQHRAISDMCAAAMASVGQTNPGSVVGLQQVMAPAEQSSVQRNSTQPSRSNGRLSRLTVREREVLALLASGATNAQLADRLTVAESTVKSHVKHILHKLGAGNRAAAIACYLRESRNDERRAR